MAHSTNFALRVFELCEDIANLVARGRNAELSWGQREEHNLTLLLYLHGFSQCSGTSMLTKILGVDGH